MFFVVCILLIVFGIMFYNICGEIYTLSDHCGWEENSIPSQEATIQNITSQQVQYTKNKAKLKTKISFSDGFYFVTYKTDRDYGFLTYKIFLSDELRKRIIDLALEKHKTAVDNFISDNKQIIFHPVNNKSKKEIEQNKIEIVNDNRYINLNANDRIEYLCGQKAQTVLDLVGLKRAIKTANNKIQDIPVGIAKYIKSEDVASLNKNIIKLENKLLAINELIKLEIEDKKQKQLAAELIAAQNLNEKVSIPERTSQQKQLAAELVVAQNLNEKVSISEYPSQQTQESDYFDDDDDD